MRRVLLGGEGNKSVVAGKRRHGETAVARDVPLGGGGNASAVPAGGRLAIRLWREANASAVAAGW